MHMTIPTQVQEGKESLNLPHPYRQYSTQVSMIPTHSPPILRDPHTLRQYAKIYQITNGQILNILIRHFRQVIRKEPTRLTNGCTHPILSLYAPTVLYANI